LLMQATGTYHHTLMVANLSEQAAEQIGANALLARVGALYHDVGKIARPYMFVENQIGKDNIHDRLDPLTSTEIITSHIKDGLDLARRYRLPSRVRAFIPEHHGTLRTSFLYHKAVERAGGDASKVDESAFRYPGPKPQSKETALLMLADGCEAAVRAKQPQTQEELAEIISQIMADRLADGQLDECPLTLHDLGTIRASFIHTLQGMFHPRIEYPELKRAPTTPALLPPEQASPQQPANNGQGTSEEQPPLPQTNDHPSSERATSQ
jgi:putative nucleotidyltransferase with HDIG domain